MANYLDQLQLPNNSTYYFRDNEAIGSLTRTGSSLIVANRVGTQTVIPNTDFDTINVTELNAGNLIVTGAARFLNTINGNIFGQAGSVANSLTIQLNGGTTEGTNKFTYNGSASKTVNITKSSIGLGNVENKSSATIRGEITSSNVTTALGYTPLNKAGDTMTGPLKFGDQAIPQFSGSPSYILGIEAFASGGDVKWQNASSLSVGSATKATQDESGNNIKSSYGASLGQDSSDGHKIFLKNKNGTQIGSTITIPDNNTTYTFAESSSNGYFTVTPSGGSAQSVKIHGLGTAAFKNTTDTYSETGTDPVTGKALKQALDGLPEPMVFKGTVGSSSATYTWDQLPTPGASSEGWTFKAIENHSTAPVCKNGDTLISNGSEWTIVPSGDEPAGTVTSVAISNGGGLSVSGSPITSSGTITISHSDTSSQASVSNSGRTYIQSVTLDTYGHVTKLTSATETVTDTNYYHKTGTWSGLTYTAAKVGSPDDLAFTIPTGTTATTVALGNHNHDGVYLKLSGGTMTGQLHFSSSAPLVYDWVHTTESPMIVLKDSPNYGIRYKEGDPDTMKFSASGNANTNNADLCINGAGDGTVTIRGNTIIHAGNYTSYTVKKDGTGASGTWGIDITGSAGKLTTNAGSATNPVYFSGGVPVACTYSLNKTVPANAVFTDTTYTIGTSGNSVTLTPSSGSAQSITVPYATSAGSATNDSNGYKIVDTYLPLKTNSGIKTCSGSGQYSWFRIATLTITGGYANGPVTFEVSQRQYAFTTLQVCFSNDSSADPGLSYFITNYDNHYYIKKVDTSVWELYGLYSEPWGGCSLHRISGYRYNFGVSVTVDMVNISEAPTGTTQAVYGGYAYYSTTSGSASSATKATQDESGNNIKATYMSSLSVASNVATFKNKNGTSLGTITASTASYGSASAGTAISADDITAWDAGSAPTLGTAISADDITAWSAGTMFSASFDGKCTLTLTSGSVPTLSYTGRSIPNVTSVGSVPSLSYTARSIPNISVSSKTVVTGIA